VIQFNIVFDDETQQQAWFAFVKRLKLQYPDDETLGARSQSTSRRCRRRRRCSRRWPPPGRDVRVYIDTDVLTEAKKRIHHIFDLFDTVVVMFSGGKDSLASCT
jgi:hypothetical protein